MKDTNIPLDIIFLNEDLEVIKVCKGIPNTENFHDCENVSYVLEVNQGSDIKVGDEMEFSNDKSVNTKMYVLNESGEKQMTLEGEERIFSRDHTKKLIKFAKKADLTRKDSDYKVLGNRLFKFLTIQSENKPEYVEGK